MGATTFYVISNANNPWRRIISLDSGAVNFHIPDDFDIGDLPEITQKWDGHTTKSKWKRVMISCNCKITEE
jgi:hypothetical protein